MVIYLNNYSMKTYKGSGLYMRKWTVAVLAAITMTLASASVLADDSESLITGPTGFPFTFQPDTSTGVAVRWTKDEGDSGYGDSQHSTDYRMQVRPDGQGAWLGEDFSNDPIGSNWVYNAVLNPATQTGSRYMNLIFSPKWRIQPNYTFFNSRIARVEFDWRANIAGTDNTMDTYFIARGGVKYFGVRASYHANSSTEPWDSTISFLSGAANSGENLMDLKQLENEREGEEYHALLKADQWYRISVTVDFETHRILKVTYRRYDAETNTFEEEPVVTLKDLPFIDYDESLPGIGAVRLESVRNTGNIESIDWNVDNFKAYEVLSGYYLTKLTVQENDEQDGEVKTVPEATVKLKGDDFSSEYVTDENGEIQTKLPPGTYSYTVTKPGYEEKSGDIEIREEINDIVISPFTPLEYDFTPETIIISGGQSSLTAPREADSFTSKPYSVNVFDQEGIEHTDFDITWAIEPADDPNVSINEETGEVTVTKGFNGGSEHIKKFTVTPTVTLDGHTSSAASTEIEISDYLFYDSGVNGSSYGDEDTPPEAHQIGGDGVYITTSAGGKDEGRRDYVGVINLPEPVEFAPGSKYEVSFDTTITVHNSTNSFGRSAIFTSSDDLDMVALDYIGNGIGRHVKTADGSTWSSKDNELEETYGTIDALEEWKHVSLSFETDDDGVTTAAITIDGKTTDLGVMEAEVIVEPEEPEEEENQGETDEPEDTPQETADDEETPDEPQTEIRQIEDLAKIKIAVFRIESPTDRFAAFKNIIIKEVNEDEEEYVTFDIPDEYIGTDALLIRAKYGDGGVLDDADVENITLSTENVLNGKYRIAKAEIEAGTTVMLWTADKYTPFGPVQTVE